MSPQNQHAGPTDAPDVLTDYLGARMEMPVSIGKATWVGIARHVMARYLRAWGVDEDLAASILLVASELLTNAHEHTDAEDAVLRMVHFAESIHVELVYFGAAKHAGSVPTVHEPTAGTENRRGLFLVECLASSWSWQPIELGALHSADFTIKPNDIALVA